MHSATNQRWKAIPFSLSGDVLCPKLFSLLPFPNSFVLLKKKANRFTREDVFGLVDLKANLPICEKQTPASLLSSQQARKLSENKKATAQLLKCINITQYIIGQFMSFYFPLKRYSVLSLDVMYE